MRFEQWAESKTRRLSVWDLGLLKLSCLAGGVLLAQVVPALRRIDTRALAVITLALAVRPAVAALTR